MEFAEGDKESVNDFEAKLLHDGIGEDFFGDALDLVRGFFTSETVEIEDEEFALTDILNFGKAERGKGALDGLSLGIEDGGLGHDPNVGFHMTPRFSAAKNEMQNPHPSQEALRVRRPEKQRHKQERRQKPEQ
jgi:hypothetical protein